MGAHQKLLTTFTSSRTNITSWHQRGRLISPSMGLKAARVALKTGARCSQSRLLGQRQILLKWEEMEISLSRLRAQFILPFPPLSGRHLECFRQSIREILPRSPSWGTLKVCPGKRLCLTSGMMFVVMEIETGTVVCRNLLNTSAAWLLIAVFFFVCFFSTLFFLL